MKATRYWFDQIEHLAKLAEQKGVTPDRLQDHFGAGALSDVFEIQDPKKITPKMRDAARLAYGLPPLQPPLLESLGTVDVLSTTDPLVVRDEFVVGKNGISYVGQNFQQWFWPKVEAPSGATTLRYSRLTRSELDEPIRDEIGAAYEETQLVHVLALIRRQKRGQNGFLLTDGRANIFYVRDASGVLRAVYVFWFDDGWYVDAHSVAHPCRWSDGDRVFSRNSSVAVAA